MARKYRALSLSYPIHRLIISKKTKETLDLINVAEYLRETKDAPTTLEGMCVFLTENCPGYAVVIDVKEKENNENLYQIHLGYKKYWAPEKDLQVFVEVTDDD